MVITTPGHHGHLLKATQEWHRLSRVDDTGVSAVHTIDERPGRGRDAAQLTQQVQSQSFRRQNAARGATDGRQPRSGRHDVAVLGEGTDLDLVVEQLEAPESDRQSGDTTGLTRDEVCRRLGLFRDGRVGRDITPLTKVFGECRRKEAVDVDGLTW